MQKNQCAREIEMSAAQSVTRLLNATVNERGRMRHEATKRIAPNTLVRPDVYRRKSTKLLENKTNVLDKMLRNKQACTAGYMSKNLRLH